MVVIGSGSDSGVIGIVKELIELEQVEEQDS